MMEEFIQRRGFDYRNFKIDSLGLMVESNIRGIFQSFTVKYEDIEFEETITTGTSSFFEKALFFSLLANLILLGIIASIWVKPFEGSIYALIIPAVVFLSIIGVWAYLIFRKKTEKSLNGKVKIIFFYEQRDRYKVDGFIQILKKKHRYYLRQRYMKIDDFIPVDQQEKLISWLFKRKIITRSELEIMMEELENLRVTKGK